MPAPVVRLTFSIAENDTSRLTSLEMSVEVAPFSAAAIAAEELAATRAVAVVPL